MFSFIQEFKISATNVRDNFNDLIGKGDARYDVTFGRTPLPTTKSFVFKDVKTLEALNEVIVSMDKLLSSNIAFSPETGSGVLTGSSTNLDDAILINSKAVQDLRTASSNSLSEAFKGALDFKMPQAVKEVTVEYGDTLEKIAFREMDQEVTNWYQIVLLNNLDPPYVSEVSITGKKTVKSGDTLLIPTFGTPDVNTTLQKTDLEITKDLTITLLDGIAKSKANPVTSDILKDAVKLLDK